MQRFLTLLRRFWLCALLTLLPGLEAGARTHLPARPDGANKYASIIVDADTLEILHARQIDGLRYPASLTKMMTLYLVFDALERGEISLNEPLSVSARAMNAAPVKLGLKRGQTITTDQAITALTVVSANDAAVVLAERLGGTMPEFARLMTAKAKALGMQRTVFRNANGLPDPGQFTTARDMAKLASALLRNHAKYYHYFGQRRFNWHGRTYRNHNTLLGKVEGVDGFKTGYTNASGYNLVISAKRHGHRLIAVVLGGASGRARDQHMADLIERGFKVQKQLQKNRAGTDVYALGADEGKTRIVREPVPGPDRINAFTLRAAYNAPKRTVRVIDKGRISQNRAAGQLIIPSTSPTENWSLQIGAYARAETARQAGLLVMADAGTGLARARLVVEPARTRGRQIYRTRLTGLSFDNANKSCQILKARGQTCLVIAP